jgi:NitT/TauT family transport system permease protein
MEEQALSVPAVETPPSAGEGLESKPVARHKAVRGAAAVFAPPAAALLALMAHKFLPNLQTFFPTRLYPLLLQVFLVATLLLALVHWVWPPLRTWARHNGPLLAGAVFLLGLWDFITLKLAWMPLPYFPGPDMVLQAIWDDRDLLLDSTYHSLKLLLTGYSAGVALGFMSGVLMGWFRAIRYWGVPVMKVFGPIPATALIPLAMVLFTDLFFSGAALIAFAVWFPVTMLTMSGIANVPVSYFDVARTLGARRTFLIFRVAIPAAMPSIFIGVFMGLLASFLTLIVAETVGVKNGLGWYMLWKKGYAEYDKVYGALAIMAVFCSGILTLLFKARDWVLTWQKGVIRW